MTVICYDFALIYEHFRTENNALAVFCIILMVLPALLGVVFTLASPPPGLQTETASFAISVKKKDIKWILLQIFHAIFFPFAAIGRYCFLIFWWTESVFASYVGDEERTKDALSLARAPSPIELYLFLQAFIHSAPHAIVNILDLMSRVSNPFFDKVSVQAISIIASCMRMASTATLYRRFEREKVLGRKYPWRNKLEVENNGGKFKEDLEKLNKDYSSENLKESTRRQTIRNKSESSIQDENNDLIQFSPRNSEMASSFYEDSAFDSDSSSNYLAPVTVRSNENDESDNEYVRPISIIDKVAPRRQKRDYVIERVDVPPPPFIPAPRPGSLAQWAEKMVENAENIPVWLSAPPRRKHWEVIQEEPDIPRRAPRSFIRGLEPQDMTAGLVQYLGWHVRVWHVFWIIACTIENILFTALWASIDNSLDNWWKCQGKPLSI
ncbi:unnamed protein product, partial [Iphiclides podalirius]